MTAAEIPTDTDALRARLDRIRRSGVLAVILANAPALAALRRCPPLSSNAVRNSPTTSTTSSPNLRDQSEDSAEVGNLRDAVKSAQHAGTVDQHAGRAQDVIKASWTRPFCAPRSSTSLATWARLPSRLTGRPRAGKSTPAVSSRWSNSSGRGHPGDAELPARVRPRVRLRQRSGLTQMHELSIAHAVVRTVVDALPDPSVGHYRPTAHRRAVEASYRRPFTSHTTSRPRVPRSRVRCSRSEHAGRRQLPHLRSPGTVGYP